MHIEKCFDLKSTPNRVLNSEQFENGDEPKKQIKVRRNSSNTGILDDAFAEGLKNSDQVSILANCLDSFKRQEKARPFIVKVPTYHVRVKVLQEKRKLKGTAKCIT